MSDSTAISRRCFLAGCGTAWLTGQLAAQDPVVVPAIDERIRQQAADAALAMQFRGSSAEECRRWQADFAARLRMLLGPHAPPAQWRTTVERSVDRDDHRRQELVLAAEGVPPLPLHLLVPKPDPGRRAPGILAIHGHGAHGYHPVAGNDDVPGVANAIRNANYDYGRQLVRRGYVVAVPCLTPFGRRLGNRDAGDRQDPCADTFIRLQLLGKLLIAENLRDCLWSVELLARHDRVDAARLGCVGLSYGGRMTMLTTALEPRIQAAVISGALNVMQERIRGRYSCGAQVIPGLLPIGDVPEIASLIAPRHCLWEVGSRDSLISPQWAEEALTRMRRPWRALAAEDRLQVDRFEGGHVWHGDVAYPLLEKVLRPGA
jgi:dienelactone hydrolase